MNDLKEFDVKKREQYDIEHLSTVKIKDRDEAEDIYKAIQDTRSALLKEVAENNNVKERQLLHDMLYDLKTARFNIQTQLTHIAKININARRHEQ